PRTQDQKLKDQSGSDVVVTGGGVVLLDDGGGINAEGAQEVDPAADAIAVAAARAGLAAEGEVVLDDALHQVFYGPAAVEPTAQAVAALAAVAAGCADGQVMGDGAVGHCNRRNLVVAHPAPEAAATVARGAAGVRATALGLVVIDDAAGDGERWP